MGVLCISANAENNQKQLSKHLTRNTLSPGSFNYDFDLISQCGFPYIAKHSESLKYGLISHNGQWITEPNYDRICDNENFSLEDAYLFYLKFDKGEKKGVINIFGKEIFCEKIEWLRESELDDVYIDFIDNYH